MISSKQGKIFCMGLISSHLTSLGWFHQHLRPQKNRMRCFIWRIVFDKRHTSPVYKCGTQCTISGWKLFIKLKTVGVLPNKVHQWLSSQTLVKLNPGCCEYAHSNGPSPKGSQVGYVKTTRNTCLFGMWPFISILFPVSYYKQTFSFCKTANSCEISLSWN